MGALAKVKVLVTVALLAAGVGVPTQGQAQLSVDTGGVHTDGLPGADVVAGALVVGQLPDPLAQQTKRCTPIFIPDHKRQTPYLEFGLFHDVSYDTPGQVVVTWHAYTNAFYKERFNDQASVWIVKQPPCVKKVELTTKISDSTNAPGCEKEVEGPPATDTRTKYDCQGWDFQFNGHYQYFRYWGNDTVVNVPVTYFGPNLPVSSAPEETATWAIDQAIAAVGGYPYPVCNRTLSTVRVRGEGWYWNNLDQKVRALRKVATWTVHSDPLTVPYSPDYNEDPDSIRDCAPGE